VAVLGADTLVLRTYNILVGQRRVAKRQCAKIARSKPGRTTIFEIDCPSRVGGACLGLGEKGEHSPGREKQTWHGRGGVGVTRTRGAVERRQQDGRKEKRTCRKFIKPWGGVYLDGSLRSFLIIRAGGKAIRQKIPESLKRWPGCRRLGADLRGGGRKDNPSMNKGTVVPRLESKR